ncbi:MAG: zinc-ribbon domain-containing protein [Candidatus Methanoperedens sp.]|nr:zinc-ribbon domain-containing protein [Candidatus Methanoperedens sp.]
MLHWNHNTSAQTAYQNAQSKLGSAQNSFNQNTKQSFDLATQYANEAINYINSAKADADNARVLATQASELQNAKSNAGSAISSANSAINSASSSIATAQNTITAAKNSGADASNAEVKLTSAQTAYQNAQSKLGSAQNSFNQNTKQSFDLATQYANEATNYANSAKADADNARVLATQAKEKYDKESKEAATALLSIVSGFLLITAIILLRRRKKSKQELSKELESVPLPLQVKEQPKKSPPEKLEEKGTIDVKSAFGYKGATILYKVKFENTSPAPIADIKVSLFVPNVFLLLEKEKSLALLKPGESKTVTFDIRPTGECGDCEVSGKVAYYDTASNRTKETDIESKMLSIVCPMLKVKEISESDWQNTVSNLLETEESTKDIDMSADTLFNMASRIIKDMHMHMLKPEVTQDKKLFNGVARFYCEGIKGLHYAAQIEVVGGARKSKLIMKAWAEKEDALTGFYHGVLDEIEKRVKVKEYIDDSIVQYNVHIGDKIGTLVKDSVVQRSNIGASMRKCPNCGREVEANEKFCLECGAKLTY